MKLKPFHVLVTFGSGTQIQRAKNPSLLAVVRDQNLASWPGIKTNCATLRTCCELLTPFVGTVWQWFQVAATQRVQLQIARTVFRQTSKNDARWQDVGSVWHIASIKKRLTSGKAMEGPGCASLRDGQHFQKSWASQWCFLPMDSDPRNLRWHLTSRRATTAQHGAGASWIFECPVHDLGCHSIKMRWNQDMSKYVKIKTWKCNLELSAHTCLEQWRSFTSSGSR